MLPGHQGLSVTELVIPAGATSIQIAATFSADLTASLTVRWGQAGIYNLTTLGIGSY